MNPANDHLRHERKLLPVGYDLPGALSLVHRHPAGFREIYPPRWLNNLYLDTPALTDYHDHVNGLPQRGKSRIRWYGSLHGPIPRPALERKLKRGTLSSKRTHALPPLAMNGSFGEHKLRKMLGSVGPEDPLWQCLDQRQPSLINRYHRHYFLNAQGDIRLTVDSELSFRAPEDTSDAMVRRPPEECSVVIEIKHAPDDGKHASDVTNWFPCRVARCSKYVLGIEALHCV